MSEKRAKVYLVRAEFIVENNAKYSKANAPKPHIRKAIPNLVNLSIIGSNLFFAQGNFCHI
ncbi:MAG: hypothetical protein WAN47_11050 [Nitrosotalea sp.]